MRIRDVTDHGSAANRRSFSTHSLVAGAPVVPVRSPTSNHEEACMSIATFIHNMYVKTAR
jgi:hypothetical protein